MKFEIKVNKDLSLKLRKVSDAKKYIQNCLDTFKNKTAIFC